MILVHTCCATCALKLVKSIEKEQKVSSEEMVIYFYNPNIHPQSEWHKRRIAVKERFEPSGYRIVVENWVPSEWWRPMGKLVDKRKAKNEKLKTISSELRCPQCYRVRLEKTFQYAKEHGFDNVTSTMVTSEYMDQEQIKKIGLSLEKKYGVKFYVPDEVLCDVNLKGEKYYMQNYCGCVFSLLERMEEKYLE